MKCNLIKHFIIWIKTSPKYIVQSTSDEVSDHTRYRSYRSSEEVNAAQIRGTWTGFKHKVTRCLVVKIKNPPSFQSKGRAFDPWSGNEDHVLGN